VIARRLNIPVMSKSADEAGEHFGWFTMFAAMDAPTSSARVCAELGWKPEQPGLIEDIDHPPISLGSARIGMSGRLDGEMSVAASSV
jgi:hypothetical protein